MFDTATSTGANAVSSYANLTSTLAMATTLSFDNNFTEFWNTSDNVYTTEAPHPCDPESKDFNCSVEAFLNYHLGAKQMPLETAVWVSLLRNFIVFFPAKSIQSLPEIFRGKF